MLGLFASLASASAADGTEVYAHWRGGSVTRGEFELWLDDRQVDLDSPEARLLLDGYAVTQALAAAALEHGLGMTPVDEAVRRQREDHLYATLLKRSVAAAVEVTAEELDALVEEYPDAFVRPRRVRLFNLFKRAPVGATAEERALLRQEVEALRARVLNGESFMGLAAEHSDSETRLKEGLIGVVRAGGLPPAIDAEVMTLEEGAVSRVFESVDGLQIFFAQRVYPEVRPTRDEVRGKLEGNLRKLRIDEAWEELEATVAARADLRYFPDRRDDQGAVLVSGAGLELTTVDLEADLSEVPIRGSFGTAAARVRLEYLAKSRLLAAEARRRGLEPSDRELRSSNYRWSERLALLELARRVDGALVRPTKEEVAAYFEEHAADFERPTEFELWALRGSFQRGDQAAQREVSESLRRAAAEAREDPSRFSQLAERLSDLEGLTPPGYLGWVGPRHLFSISSNVRKAVDSLARGGVSEPIRDGDSYWVVRLADLHEARVPTLDEAFTDVERRVGQIRTDAMRGAIEESLLAELSVEIVGEVASSQRPPA